MINKEIKTEEDAILLVDDLIKNGNSGKGIPMSSLERKLLIKKIVKEINDKARS